MISVDLLVFLPLGAAVLSMLIGDRAPRAPRWFSLLAPLAMAVPLVILAGTDAVSGGRVLGVGSGSGIWALAIDGLSFPLVALTVFIGVMASVASWDVEDRPGWHHALLLVVQAGVTAVFLAENVVLFYVAWETVLIPMFLLIGGWGSSQARAAAMKFLIYTFAGGAVLLAGLIYVATTAGSLNINGIAANASEIPSPDLAFWLLAIGFLVKLPAIPLHTWLADAHTEAPTAGSILLAGVLLKMAGFGMMRVAMPIAPAGFEAARGVLAVLAVVGIVWGAACALVQTDLKRLVAYSSVAHMGFVLLAIAVATAESLSAAMVTMVSHGLVAGLLFFLVGALYGRAHTRDLSRFGGLGSVAPRWAVLFVFGSLASAGLPGLSGFPGEYVTSLAAFGTFGWWVLVVGLGIVLAAAYNLRAVRATVQGPIGGFDSLGDLGALEMTAGAAFALGIVIVGVRPALVTDVVTSSMQVLAALTGGGL